MQDKLRSEDETIFFFNASFARWETIMCVCVGLSPDHTHTFDLYMYKCRADMCGQLREAACTHSSWFYFFFSFRGIAKCICVCVCVTSYPVP